MALLFKRLNSVWIIGAVCAAVPVVSFAATVAVDATKTYQTIDGFGASSAWISSKITATLADQFWLDDTVDGHIGLSILRTIIPCSGSWNSESGSMTQARKLNPDVKIWSAVWSPPSKYKSNGSCSGGSLKSDAASQQGYADYLVQYVQDVKTKLSIDLYAVSCQNEPDWNPSYDGCQWSGAQFRDFVRDYWGPACVKAGITAKRMISESYSNNLAVSDPALKDTAAAKYVDIIGGHLYGGGPNPYPLAESLNKQYWETENSGMGGPNENIDDGIKYANIVHKCLAKCNMNAYHYWWLVNNNGDDEGLCNSSGKPTLRMYTIGNFSKFIRPGFVRVDATAAPATGITVSAYHGVSRGQLVIVAINSGSAAGKLDFTIAGFSGASTAGRWLTDNTHKLERQEPVAISGNAFSNELPAKSVTTFVVWNGITAVKGITPQPRKASPRLALQAGNRQIEMPSAYTAWTMQVLSLDGRELSRTTIPSGQRIATIGAREYSGIVVVKVQQGSMKKAFFVVQP